MSHLPIHCFRFNLSFIRLNENIIPNHGYVELRDISLASSLDCLKYNDSNHQHEDSFRLVPH